VRGPSAWLARLAPSHLGGHRPALDKDRFEAGSASRSSCTCAAPSLPASLRLHPSFRLPLAPADCCTPLHRCRPLLPPFSSTQQTPLPLHHPGLLLPSLNVGGAITSPPSHHSPVAVPAACAAAPGIALGPDRFRPSPQPWFWNHGRSRRGQSHDVEVHTVGGPLEALQPQSA
jgi:hypothetical protein